MTYNMYASQSSFSAGFIIHSYLFANVCLLTNEDTAMSAKERYLVRKRAKLSQPTISTDDPLNL